MSPMLQERVPDPAALASYAGEERRTGIRQATILGAVVHAAHRAPFRSIVRNRSEGGAQLIVSELGELPEEFDLRIGDEPLRRCRVVWRDLGVVGVAFVCADADTTGWQERRATPRRRTLKGGTIVFNGGHSTMACRIVDLSDGGARLRPVSPPSCPTAFELIISGGDQRVCHVVRRENEDLGIRFVH